jgi:hypothetical protein
VGRALSLSLSILAILMVSPCSAETVKVGGDTYNVQWIHHETFDKDWTSRWAFEGDSEVMVKDGKLCVNSLKDGKAHSATIWYKRELPDRLLIRFRARVLPPKENNAANLNVFIHARESDGSPLEFGRSGSYSEYHQIPNYIVTLTGGNQPGWSRVRRDPGFVMLHEAEVRSEVGKEYDIIVTVEKGHIRYYLNGKKWHDVQDPDPLFGGRFALRTWSSNTSWEKIEFGRINK